MFAYIGKRLLATIPVMAVVAVFVFALLRLTPGDPAAILAGASATMTAKSVRPLALSPAFAAPKRKPAGISNWDASEV